MVKKIVLMIFFASVLLIGAETKKVSDFKLKNMQGKTVKLSEALKNGPVFIDFWASWCTPCKEEMPIFNKLYGKYKDKGLSMFLITIDKGGAIQKAKSFVKSKGFDYEVLFDTNKKVFKNFGCRSKVPVTFIIDQDYNIIYKHEGKGTEKMFEEAIVKALDSVKSGSPEQEKENETKEGLGK